MAETHGHEAHGHDAHGHHEEGWFVKYFWSTDHKMIAKQYLLTGMLLGAVGAYFAYVFRMQLAFPNKPVPGYGLVTGADYNALVTNHGAIMIFWVAMPVLIERTCEALAGQLGDAPGSIADALALDAEARSAATRLLQHGRIGAT